MQEDKFYGINFNNVGERRNTIEFRYANSPKDAETWIENINLFGGIVRAAEDLAIVQAKSEEELTEEEKDLLSAFDVIKDKNATSEEKLDALLKISIPNEKDRPTYIKRYHENSELMEWFPEFKKMYLKLFELRKISSVEIMRGLFQNPNELNGQDFYKYSASAVWLDEKREEK